MGIRSEKRTTFSGREYTVHFDDNGQIFATSEERTDIVGRPYIQHLDKYGNPIGTSEKRVPTFGAPYYQHLDKYGNPTGTSEERHPVIGNTYIQHMDKYGNPTGTSEKRDPIFGQSYIDHSFSKSSSYTSSTSSSSYSSGSTGSTSSYSSDSTGSSYSGSTHRSTTSAGSYSGYSGRRSNSSSNEFTVSMTSGIPENAAILLCTGIIMYFIKDFLINLYYTNPMLFYQAVSVYAAVSPIIYLIMLHKKYKSQGAGKIAIWLMAAVNGMLIISETQLFNALLYQGSIYHFADFVRSIRFWIPLAVHGLLLGLITVLSIRKTDDQKLYIRKVSAGFHTHAICSYSAIYATIIHMADRMGNASGWFMWLLETVLLFLFLGLLTSIAIFISNIPYVIFCKYPKK